MQMAKIHKVTMYIIDPNGFYDNWGQIVDEMADVWCKTVRQQTRVFEWDDELLINNAHCPIEEYEKYFSE